MGWPWRFRDWTWPVMPLTCSIWRGAGHTWPGDYAVPDVQCRCACYPKPNFLYTPGLWKLLLHPNTDIRSQFCEVLGGAGPAADLVECPAGSGHWFQVQDVADNWLGWARKYRQAFLYPCQSPVNGSWWPAPIS
ncbi:MAG: hypothetical protein WCA89_12230 [Terracidiphilus sp.]